MPEVVQLPNQVLLPEVGALLESGTQVCLRAKGNSMRPTIRHEKDSLIVVPIDRRTLGLGDIVLAKVSDGRYVAHRIVGKRGDDGFVLQGDGNLRGTETCRRADVLGRVEWVLRGGTRRVHCQSRCRRWMAAVTIPLIRLLRYGWHGLRKTARIALALFR